MFIPSFRNSSKLIKLKNGRRGRLKTLGFKLTVDRDKIKELITIIKNKDRAESFFHALQDI